MEESEKNLKVTKSSLTECEIELTELTKTIMMNEVCEIEIRRIRQLTMKGSLECINKAAKRVWTLLKNECLTQEDIWLLNCVIICVVEFGKPSGHCRNVPEKQQHVFKGPPC